MKYIEWAQQVRALGKDVPSLDFDSPLTPEGIVAEYAYHAGIKPAEFVTPGATIENHWFQELPTGPQKQCWQSAFPEGKVLSDS